MWDSKVYIRKLYAQELGFRRGTPGQAGRYIFISKSFAGYFPPLSDAVLNDNVIIKTIPDRSDKIVLATFKYHNSKIVHCQPNGRDEYRLYLNSEIDPQRNYFKIDDIIMLHKFVTPDDLFYKAYRYSKTENPEEYQLLEKLLYKYGSGQLHTHALVPREEIKFLKTGETLRIREKIIPEEVQKNAFSEPIESDFTEDRREQITRLVRSSSFRDLVLFFYESKCAITESAISYSYLCNLEAAHIIPREHKGQNSVKNGLALSRDFHWAFDKGFYTINDEYVLTIHPEAKNNQILVNFNNKKIFLPQDKRAWPSLEALQWHKKHIYGSFLNSL